MGSLEELYERKKEAIKIILELTQKQRLAIEREEMAELHALLQKRQTLMDRVDQKDREISQLKISGGGAATNQLKQEIDVLLQQTVNQDEQNKILINQHFVDIKQKITQLKNNRTVQQAYYPSKQQNFGYFLDNKK